MEGVISWIVVGFFGAVGVLFLTQHGWQLIAGYNTASEEKKARYDLKRLYLVNGIGMLVLGLLLMGTFFFTEQGPLILDILLIVGIIVTIVLIVVLTGTWCRKKTENGL
jgi:O-antigen/teichoic acid export membrane protein